MYASTELKKNEPCFKLRFLSANYSFSNIFSRWKWMICIKQNCCYNVMLHEESLFRDAFFIGDFRK